MTQTASSKVPVVLTEDEAGLDVITFPREFAPVIAELSEVTAARLALEKREKSLKKQLTAALPMSDAKEWPRGLVVGLRVVGLKGILAKIAVRHRTNVSSDILKEKYPEAYEAAKSESAYLSTTTA